MALALTLLRVNQGGLEFYTGAIRAEDLIRSSAVAEWSEDGVDGYQRAPEAARIRRLALFLTREAKPLLPTAVLLSSRGVAGNVEDLGGGLVRYVASGVRPLWIVDGQHRVAGLEMAIFKHGADELRDFEIPIVLLSFESVREEALQFKLINQNMKKVSTALARRLLELSGPAAAVSGSPCASDVWQVQTVSVVRRVSLDPTGVWYRRIKPPNATDSGGYVIPELSFGTSLRPLLKPGTVEEFGLPAIADFVFAYWAAWERSIPDAFADPHGFVIQKSPGVFGLHAFAADIIGSILRGSENHGEAIVEALSGLSETRTARYWQSGNVRGAAAYGSMAGFKHIAERIRQERERRRHEIGSDWRTR